MNKHVYLMKNTAIGFADKMPAVCESYNDATKAAQEKTRERLHWVKKSDDEWEDWTGSFTIKKTPLFKRGTKR